MSAQMMPREKAVAFIKRQMVQLDECTAGARYKASAWHYGVQDLRLLLDAIYGGPPANDQQSLEKPGARENWELPK